MNFIKPTILIAGLAIALGSSAFGQSIVGSEHDFSGETWNNTGEICRVCHVPHDRGRASLLGTRGLLWNHALSTQNTFTMYDSPSMNATAATAPTGGSKPCLGCHDGTVALDDFDAQTGGNKFIGGGKQIPNTGNGAGDFTNTHPISITYDYVPGMGLNDPATTAMGNSGMINDVLENGVLQCGSCHDVHNSPAAVPGTHLLRVAQTAAQGGVASGLCLTCHDK
jgi:hypothetical protein